MRTPMLGRTAAFAALLALSACLTGSNLCPRSLDCARAGRHFCRQGSSHCGPCLYPLVEDHHGRCVDTRRHLPSAQAAKGKVRVYPELDEEIDVLSGIISEQRTESRMPAPPSLDMKAEQLIRPISRHRGSPTDQPSSLSITLSTTSPSSTTSCSPGQLGEPRFTAYPRNDQVFLNPLQTIGSATLLSSVWRLQLPETMSSSDSHRPAAHSLPLIFCCYVFSVMTSVIIAVCLLVLVISGICCVRMMREAYLEAQKLDYPACETQNFVNFPGDQKLAHSAQMYHYQHQKQQMLSLQQRSDELRPPDTGTSTDEENDGDFTVYECPGLAPTGEMEVKNPLFDDANLYLHRFHKKPESTQVPSSSTESCLG
ncbi:neural proliferation differentiation and control protein 1-like isoform X2 [Poecilia formosa]|uniref:neural proliferation differentiation and control protein 1-like isoform X2 n=1 Tax=Poecilia formosa TaxID=48698 RepID=UPI0007B9D75F|nr:PREDICTED: neural proliferation differentiation and control protein 1-like isoform X2 [Poecilia formosa]